MVFTVGGGWWSLKMVDIGLRSFCGSNSIHIEGGWPWFEVKDDSYFNVIAHHVRPHVTE